MQTRRIQKIIIVGGGTSGWMTAAALSNVLHKKHYTIELVESDSISTVGVGEATIPHIRHFNNSLGIDEADFIRATQASYKLGIRFIDWGRLGSDYIHPFGAHGHPISDTPFHQFFNRLKRKDASVDIGEYSLAIEACRQNRFAQPSNDTQSIDSTYAYAYHMDASLYAAYLQRYSIQKGVKRTEGLIQQVRQAGGGSVTSIKLRDDRIIEGDLFIDCSGFRGLIIEETLKAGYEHWNHWLPCDRAITVSSKASATLPPYTIAKAHPSGWQWKIPLQSRTGNGYVYSSQHISDEQALETLITNTTEQQLGEPKQLRFHTGRRKKSWVKNCIAIGLSAGFLEPLESTGIYLIQQAIQQLIQLFPSQGITAVLVNEYNRNMDVEYQRVRDFLILHYHLNQRMDSKFWRQCQSMSIPDSLQHKMELFSKHGHISHYERGLFFEPSWVSVFLGQGLTPEEYDSRVDGYSARELDVYLSKIKQQVQSAASSMPFHNDALQRLMPAVGAP